MTLLPRTLTSRLVVTAVALVALVSLLLSLATTLAMRSYLTERLDTQLVALAGREGRLPAGPHGREEGPEDPGHHEPDGIGDGPRGLGTLVVNLTNGSGGIVSEENTLTRLSSKNLVTLREAGAGPVTVRLGALGEYRVLRASGGAGPTVAYGLPTEEIDRSVARLLMLSSLLALAGVSLAALLGTALVRRQLRPLRAVAETAHEVSALPLADGGQTISTRVDSAFTDPETEVGQVGSALNTLLDHVDAALDARHRSEQQVRQFVADASHELRTPLSTIHGYAELSRRTAADPEALSHAMGKVETEAHRMSALVEDLLLLARLDQGRPLEQAEVDLTLLLLELVSDIKVVAPQHHWRLTLPEEPITLTGDSRRLHQVFSNLLNNARRHTPAGTTVTVTAQSGPAEVMVSVHDDGPGVAAELQPRIFERFARGDASRTRESGDGKDGAGLGLSLALAITQAHQGRVSLDSRPGDTTFTVHLPRRTPPQG